MTFTVSITSQGQLNIPVKIRRMLDFDQTKKAIVTIKDGKLIVEPVKDLLMLGGSLQSTKKQLSNKELHNLFANSIAKKYKNKLNNLK